jgi:hypothetical protein
MAATTTGRGFRGCEKPAAVTVPPWLVHGAPSPSTAASVVSWHDFRTEDEDRMLGNRLLRLLVMVSALSGVACGDDGDDTTGTGGVMQTGGIGGSTAETGGATGAGGTAAWSTEPVDCAEVANSYLQQCPDNPGSWDITCEQGNEQYAPIGCGDEWNAYLNCFINAEMDCEFGGPIGCDQAQDAYFACQSQATMRTGCTYRSAGLCAEPTPYEFVCVGEAPAECVLVNDAGAGLWCCPALG